MSSEKQPPVGPVSQKFLAQYLDLSPATISLVMNRAPLADRIAEDTKKRILDAAKKFDYRPDFYARYLSRRRSYTVAVMLPGVSETFISSIVAGIDARLVSKKYFYFLANHHSQQEQIEELPRLLIQRAVEGFILINTPLSTPLDRPTVSIGRMAQIAGVSQVMLDNERGGWLAVEHLVRLGHRKIAVIKGYPSKAAAAERWAGIEKAAQTFRVEIDPRLVVELKPPTRNSQSIEPEGGYRAARELLSRKRRFTGLISFNDISAFGAIRAFHDAGLTVPTDVSVIGFDDIQAAAFQIPTLTTLRQPMSDMGEIAASTLLSMIEKKNGKRPVKNTLVEPELVPRESTRHITDWNV